MKFYQEITLLPNPEVSLNFLWSKVFQQIHIGLVEMKNDSNQVPIGISFPEYTIGKKYSILGSKLRLFAQNESTLVKYDATKWLARLNDYLHFTGIRSIPEKLTGYAIYQREQHKTGQERLARRYAKREEKWKIEGDEARLKKRQAGRANNYEEMEHKVITTPFINLKSLSSDNTLCLWIKKTPTATSSSDAVYSTYGLSSKFSLPEF